LDVAALRNEHDASVRGDMGRSTASMCTMAWSDSDCIAKIRLGADEIAWLDARPYAAHEVNPNPSCQLEVGHQGPHAALGQQGDGVEWWTRWTLNAWEIAEVHICPAKAEGVDDLGNEDVCLLSEGHPGRHSFDF
jgi:hypothetical protein